MIFKVFIHANIFSIFIRKNASFWINVLSKSINLILSRIMCSYNNNSRNIYVTRVIERSNLLKRFSSFLLLLYCFINCLAIYKFCSTINIQKNTLNTRFRHEFITSPCFKVVAFYPFTFLLIVESRKLSDLEEIYFSKGFFHHRIEKQISILQILFCFLINVI